MLFPFILPLPATAHKVTILDSRGIQFAPPPPPISSTMRCMCLKWPLHELIYLNFSAPPFPLSPKSGLTMHFKTSICFLFVVFGLFFLSDRLEIPRMLSGSLSCGVRDRSLNKEEEYELICGF